MKPYEEMMLADFTTETVTINEVDYTYNLPTSIYYKNTDGTSASFGRYFSSSYTGDSTFYIPDRIVATEITHSLLGDTVTEYKEEIGGNGGYLVNAIDVNAFRLVDFVHTTLNTGKYVTVIETNTLTGSYLTASYNLVLESVETVNTNAVSSSKILSLTANKLKVVNQNGFGGCSNLKEVNLPAIEQIFNHGFRNCASLQSVVLGENFKETKEYSFCVNPMLTEVIVLSLHSVKWGATINSNVFYHSGHSGTPTDKIKILVSASVYDEYSAGNRFGGLTISNIGVFENSTIDTTTNHTYFYTLLGNDEAELTFIKAGSAIGDTFTIPSTFTNSIYDEEGNATGMVTYTVTKISSGFMSALANVGVITKCILPTNLKEFVDDYSSISVSLAELEIADTNECFSTVEGVLYNKEGTTLVYYPCGKSDESFVVGNGVEIIAEGAFYGNLNVQSVTIRGDVIMAGSVFEGCRSLSEVTFEGNVVFAGRDVFSDCSEDLVIYVPSDKVDEIKQSLIFDKELVDRIKAIA